MLQDLTTQLISWKAIIFSKRKRKREEKGLISGQPYNRVYRPAIPFVGWSNKSE